MHMSTSVQILGTLNNFFAKKEGEEDDKGFVWILRVKYQDVEKFIKWEDSKGKGPEEVVCASSFCLLLVLFFLSFLVELGWGRGDGGEGFRHMAWGNTD